MNRKNLLDQLAKDHTLPFDGFVELLAHPDEGLQAHAASLAVETTQQYYGNKVFSRGLIEFTNICQNNCYYCGIRAGNENVQRYRLTDEQILQCAATGYQLGFRTFVLQGGEDPYYTDDKICRLVQQLKHNHPDCAITLSIGEKSRESYERFRQAGAERYLLRHETATPAHYHRLHPPSLSAENRYACLHTLKELGFQTGAGFMVGSPGQTPEDLARDLLFLHKLQPEMVGIGPFIPAAGTPFAQEPAGTLNETLFLLSLIRLLLPDVLLPATTALGTIDPRGREKGILAGANVVMPNLSPKSVRKKYQLYDNKICTGEEAAECIVCLTKRIESVGRELAVDRGDNVRYVKMKEDHYCV
ncbi:biotin synthase [Selenomonas sp. GACV-9]|uniref:[FeFe] hydrogenase H-cluster radical SAM maturase HydE n=1 Tax=Selenomonas sp. GACV-9 TaxID=3158782 RepID=UPI0008F1BC61|nr:biotin synthase [Selenomonas ruminantium]